MAQAQPVDPVLRAAVVPDGRLDPIEASLVTLLQRRPRALVFAIGGEGSPKLVRFPRGIPLRHHRVIEETAESALDLVDRADHPVVAKLWGQARNGGAAVAQVHLLGDPDHLSNLYIFDVRRTHHAFIGVCTERESGPDPLVDPAPQVRLAPRTARATKNASALITWVEPAFSDIVGWPTEELVGRRAMEFVHPEDHEIGIANWLEMIDVPGSVRRVRLRHRHRDGSWIWLEVSNHNRLADPQHGDVLSEMIDVSEEMGALEALHAREQLLAQLTETVPVGLFHADLEGNLLFSNGRLHEITETVAGSNLAELFAGVLPEDRPSLDDAIALVTSGEATDLEIRVASADHGVVVYCTVSLRPLRAESGSVAGLTGCVDDVTDTVASRKKLESMATRDHLTGCLNRAATLSALQDLLDSASSGSTTTRSGTAAIFVDIDRLKPINDEFGHAAGDELLIRAADWIRTSIRSGDVVGRIGGDEFLVACPGVRGAEQALGLARSLASRAFAHRLELPGRAVEVRASMGVAWTAAPRARASELVRRADIAMYRAKHEGRGEPVMYSETYALETGGS